MGSWLSHLWWGGDPDLVHPSSGLTRREVYAVQKSWAPVYAQSLETGTELLKRYFRNYPEAKEFFRMVRKLPEEEYAQNVQFRAHVVNLMSSLNTAVVNLHQPEVVAVLMNKLGQSHKPRHVRQTHFEVAMGSWLSHLRWGGDPDLVHPSSGLTRRDIYAVQKSWIPVYAQSMETGTEILKRFFRSYPETKEFFKMLRKLPEEQYAQNVQFRAHVVSLMATLNMAVMNLHQPEVVAALMNKLGDSHNRRQIRQMHFDDLKKVLVTMFIEVLKLDEATLGAWGKTVDFWYKHIFEALDHKESK